MELARWCPAFQSRPVAACARAGKVNDVIGAADRLFIVFDTSTVLPRSRSLVSGRAALIVARMQADRRLIKHIEHAAQLRTDLGGQADALAFAAERDAAGRSSVMYRDRPIAENSSGRAPLQDRPAINSRAL